LWDLTSNQGWGISEHVFIWFFESDRIKQKCVHLMIHSGFT
jgi:hypothetical protein